MAIVDQLDYLWVNIFTCYGRSSSIVWAIVDQLDYLWQASKLMPARMPGAAKIFAGPVNSSYWLPAQHSKLEPAGNYHTNGDLG